MQNAMISDYVDYLQDFLQFAHSFSQHHLCEGLSDANVVSM